MISDDLSALGLRVAGGPDDLDVEIRSGRVFVGADAPFLRRMELSGWVMPSYREVSIEIDVSNYRDVQGLQVPHRIVFRLQDTDSPPDSATMAQIEQLEAVMSTLPEQQRSIMARQIERAREGLDALEAARVRPLERVVEVTEVRVNTGPPGG